MSGNGDGEEPWSEDDLFDLDSALSFGAHIEEIAVFLRREDVERKAYELNRPNPCGLVRGTKASIGGRAKSSPLSRSRNAATQALEDQTPEAMLHRSEFTI